jgi:hypothetical protein
VARRTDTFVRGSSTNQIVPAQRIPTQIRCASVVEVSIHGTIPGVLRGNRIAVFGTEPARRCSLLRRLWMSALHAEGLPIGLRDQRRHEKSVLVRMRGLLRAGPQYLLQDPVQLPRKMLQGPYRLEAHVRLRADSRGACRKGREEKST